MNLTPPAWRNDFLPGLLAVALAVAAALPGGQTVAEESQLTERQLSVANRYQRLEELLLRLAEVEAAENPERSALLRRAARQSRDKFVLEKMRNASESLRTEEFQKAVDNQSAAKTELSALLKLLLSEDRSKRIRDEKERYQKLAKELKRALRAQQSTRARTENNADMKELEGEQKSIGDRTENLSDELAEEDETSQSPSPSESQDKNEKDPGEKGPRNDDGQSNENEGQPEDDNKKPEDDPKKSGEQQPKEQEPGEREPNEKSGENPSDSKQQNPSGDNKQSPQNQNQPPQSENQQQSPQNQSQQSQSPQNQSQPPQSQNQPASPEQQIQQQLKQAIEKMRQAEQELEKAEREKATQQQRDAEENLRAAIDRLERILRQLREEEMQRELAKLESRLRKMAAMQSQVLDDTVALAATPTGQRNRQTDLKAGDLAFEEKKITMEADRALLLLREEGSSVAFPEVISQIADDTVRVSNFLAETKIDTVTQGIQKDILAALEEMIAATQKAQRELEQKRQQQQQGKPRQSGQQEEPLVEALAELRLIRTMETRIKSTTERYAGLIESGDQATEDLLPLLQDLSERQNRLYQITRDLVLKRNK